MSLGLAERLFWLYEKKADEIKDNVLKELRGVLHCPSSPPGSRKSKAYIQGMANNVVDTGKSLTDAGTLLLEGGVESWLEGAKNEAFIVKNFIQILEKGAKGDVKLAQAFAQLQKSLLTKPAQ